MAWIIGVVVVIALFFLLTPNLAKSASVREDVESFNDESVVREHARVTRWLTHYVGASSSFRNSATSSGSHEAYQKYHTRLTEELKRRDFARKILASIPEFRALGEAGYVSLLNDGMIKIAWQMKKSGNSDQEIHHWIMSELAPTAGASQEAQNKSPESKTISIINDVVELLWPIYVYRKDPVGLNKEEMHACSISEDDYTRVTFIANLAYSFRVICTRSVFAGTEEEFHSYAVGIMNKNDIYVGNERESILSESYALAQNFQRISVDEAAESALHYVVSELNVSNKSIQEQFEKMYLWWHIRPVTEGLNNAFLQAGYRGLVIMQ